MKILIIGGTKFSGRHIIRAARRGGHEVTLFNRGTKYFGEEIENVEHIRGDRNLDLDQLAGRRWDVCLDTCGYLPQSVRASAEFLRDSVGRYIFISSISAYADFSRTNSDESAALAELTGEQRERFGKIDPKDELSAVVLGEMYGALKALCERAAERAMPGRTLIVRPGLIVGEFDWTDRFSYWVMRVARGGKVLAPGSPERFVQFIDAADLAQWIVKMAEESESGAFNLTSRPFELSFGAFLNEIKSVLRSDAEFVWADGDFLKRENVAAWSDMPLYLRESEKDWRGFLSVNVDRALAKGLDFRPLGDTIRAVFEWRSSLGGELKAGVAPEREAALLAKLAGEK